MSTEIITTMPISYSRIEAFNCPNYFRNKYILKIDDGAPKENLLCGRFVHRVADQYNKELLANKLEADFTLFNVIFKDLWNQNKEIPESLYDDLQDMLITFAERHTIDVDNTLGSEIKIALNANLQSVEWLADDVWFRMVIDQVNIYNTKAKIIDYKTSRHIPSDSEVKQSLQGKIYAFGLSTINSYLEEFEIEFNFIRWGVKKSVTYNRQEAQDTEHRLRRFSDMLSEKLNDPNAEWPAILNDNICPICSYTCPWLEKGISIVRTIDEAKDAGNKIQVLKMEASKIQKQLQAWCKNNESSIDIGIGQYGYFPTLTISIPPASIAQFCLEKGLDINQFLKTNTDIIKEMSDENLKQQILTLATKEPKQGTRFQYKTNKEMENKE